MSSNFIFQIFSKVYHTISVHERIFFTINRQTETTSRTARKFLTKLVGQMSNHWLVNPLVPTTATVAVLPLWSPIVRVLDEVETNGESLIFGATILHNFVSLRKFQLQTVIRYERKFKARIWFFLHFSISSSKTVKIRPVFSIHLSLNTFLSPA